MSDNNENDFTSKFPHLTPIKAAKVESSLEKQRISREIKKLTPDSDWTILQDICHDIQANYIIEDPNIKPSAKTLRDGMVAAVKQRYGDEPELQALLQKGIPSEEAIYGWFKKEGWDEAVWKKLHETGLFSKERRTAMINALFKRGMERDTTAAKIWLTMSGDFVEKSQIDNKDSTVEKFREINTILHKKKEG